MHMFQESEEKMIKRLSGHAGNIIDMLKAVFKTPRGSDIRMVLIFASGLAGCACHEAVIKEKGCFAIVSTKNGKRFYFGDDVNKYLLESRLSVVGSCQAVTDVTQEEVMEIVSSFAENVGNSDLAICGFQIGMLYKQIKQCWDGIFNNMTNAYCKSPSEWPVLYGIVTQEVLRQAMSVGAPSKEAGKMAIECAVAISKMDKDSI